MDLFEFLTEQEQARRSLLEVEPPAEAAAFDAPPVDLPPPVGEEVSGRSLLAGLNPQQQEAVLHKDGPLLVLAGAGSGKTMVITRRIAHLIQQEGVSPFHILAITFTNKAAQEMKERIARLVGGIAERMWVGTFHSMFMRILRQHSELLGYPRQFTIVDADDQLALVKRVMKELSVPEERFKPRQLQSRISTAKNGLLDVRDFEQTVAGPVDRVVAEVYERYQQRLRESNAMDFDDILLNMVKLLKQFPDVLELWQDRFRYILVDEYQDTNAAQYEAVRLLARKHKNICVVGDDDQSIYSFRGADLSNILNFEKDYKRCKVIKLEQNYRSTGTILDSANRVIANNRGRKRKKLWTGSSSGEPITFYRGYDQYDEGRFVADEILKRVRNPRAPLNYSDVAVLYRNNALSRSMESAFRERRIPYRVFGGMRFYDRKEIKDVLAYLKLILLPDDNLSFERIINVPRRGIGATTVETMRVLAAREGVSSPEICRRAFDFPELSRAARKLSAFAELMQALRLVLQRNELSFEEFIEHVENESGLIQSIAEEQESGKNVTVDRIENLKELLSDAKEFTANFIREGVAGETDFWNTDGSVEAAAALSDEPPTLTELLTAFLEQSALYSQMDLEDSGDDYVRLMTIHSAKGLEFKVVFLIAAEETIFPGRRSLDSPEGEEEERRLAYVAITRAREKLYVTTARSRMLYGQTQCLPVSRFIREMPPEALEEIGGSTRSDALTYGVPHPSEVSAAPPDRGRRASRRTQETRKGLDYLRQGLNAGETSALPARPAAQGGGYLLPQQLRQGMRVVHARFGAGRLVSSEAVAGDAVVVIQFDNGMKKTLLLKQARLKKE